MIIACYNIERYLDAAIASALSQSLTDLEILVVDDRSTDSSRACAEAYAAIDPRVMVLDGPGRGPAAARNVALRQAKGEWVAILDGDDLMHPRRLETLLSDAESSAFDMIADNLLVFYDPPEAGKPDLLLKSPIWRIGKTIDLATYLTFERLLSSQPPLGYLKPLIRREFLAHATIEYDESLRIAEDADLAARLLAAGASFGYVPHPWYFYRRRDDSVSYRIMPSDVAAMIAATGRFDAMLPPSADKEWAASGRRRRSLENAAYFTVARGQFKGGSWGVALFTLLMHPRSYALAAKALYNAIKRRSLERLERARQSARRSPRSRALILWAGEHGTARKLARSMKKQGIISTVVAMRKSAGVFDTLLSIDLLVKIANDGPFDQIFYNDGALLDMVPYALSPGARLKNCASDKVSVEMSDGLESDSRPALPQSVA